MRFICAQQVDYVFTGAEAIDLFIAASGFESRCRHVASNTPRKCIKKGIAFSYDDRKVLARPYNDLFFSRIRFESVQARGDDAEILEEYLLDAVRSCSSREMVIVLDYSAMTKVWYSRFLAFLANLDEGPDRIRVLACYSPAKFHKPKRIPSPTAIAAPLHGYSFLSLPNKPIAMVIGLGYEPLRAFGCIENFEPREVYAFYTDPAADARYVPEVRKNNAALLKAIGPDRVFTHPLNNLDLTATTLASVCDGLNKDCRLVFAPIGTKPFALLCMLYVLSRGFGTVYRISSGFVEDAYDAKAIGPIVACEISLSK